MWFRHKRSLLWKISELFIPGEVKRKGEFWGDQAACVCVFSHLVPPTITRGISDNHAKVLRTHTHTHTKLNLSLDDQWIQPGGNWLSQLNSIGAYRIVCVCVCYCYASMHTVSRNLSEVSQDASLPKNLFLKFGIDDDLRWWCMTAAVLQSDSTSTAENPPSQATSQHISSWLTAGSLSKPRRAACATPRESNPLRSRVCALKL